MIRKIEELKSLPPIEQKNPDPAPRRSFGRRVSSALRLALFLVLVPFLIVQILFTMLWHIAKFFLKLERSVEKAEESNRQAEQEGGFLYDMVSASNKYDHGNDTLHTVMNDHALKLFSFTIRKSYSRDAAQIQKQSLVNRLLFGTALTPQDPGFHFHSEFFMELEHEITVGTDNGSQLKLNGGASLFASPQVWLKLCDEFDRVAKDREPQLLVLDAYEKEYCDPESRGRFILEYRPDYRGVNTAG